MSFGPVASMPSRLLMLLPGSGCGTRLQALPFQCIISDPGLLLVPTAHTSLAEIAFTAQGIKLYTSGPGTMLHAFPSQCSMSCSEEVPWSKTPTVHASPGATADTENKRFCEAVITFGLLIISHGRH